MKINMRRDRGFYREVCILATPIILQNLITSTLAMADTFMVGLLGEAEMAAVTLANIPLFVIQIFIFGVQSGCGVIISQYWGKKDMEAINRVIGVGFWLAGVVSFLGGMVLLIWPYEFLSLFGNDDTVIRLAAEYGRIAGASWFLNAFTMIYIASYRSMEKPKLGMYILMISMICNPILNWIFIFGNLGAPAMGVSGAALGTLISRGAEIVVVFIHIRRTKSFRMIPKLIFRPGMDMVRRFGRYGSPVVFNETMWGLGTSIYPTIMGHMENSTEILAAYTIVGNIEKLFMVIAFGIASTAAVMIGREIGAGRSHTVHQTGVTLNVMSITCGLVLGSLLLLFTFTIAPTLVFPVFHLSPISVKVATMMLIVQGILMPLKDFNTCNIVGVLRGGGDMQMATVIDTAPLWLVAIPVATVAGLVLRLDVLYVYMGLVLEQLIKFIIGVWRLRSGKWVRDITQ